MVDRMYCINKVFIVSGILLSIVVPSYAFDMDAALAIYQAENNKQYQNIEQQQVPQQRTREYYQQKWLEQQGQAQVAEPEINGMQGQQRYLQTAPESEDLFLAAVNGNNAQIAKLLAQGLDINTSNAERETALHMAAARGHYSTVIYLINNGAYIKARTVKNWTPLHHAVRFSHPNIVNYLMKRGSSAHEKTSDGLSAIDMARNVNDYRLLSILGAR
jgi:ankyrin repeat protein